MKKTIHAKRNYCIIFCPLLFAFSLSASAYSSNCDTAVIKKISGNKDQQIVIYSNTENKTLVFSAKFKQKKNYRFYMFDMDGKLVAENDIFNKQGVEFTNMQKGEYYFEIFSNDDRVENGTLTIK